MTDAPGSSATPAVDADALAYDDAFAELQRVVTALEAGGTSLEATIALYERAVALQRRCERLLAEAELRVQQLMARPGWDPCPRSTSAPMTRSSRGHPAGASPRGRVKPSCYDPIANNPGRSAGGSPAAIGPAHHLQARPAVSSPTDHPSSRSHRP